jgi:hypothetical protein
VFSPRPGPFRWTLDRHALVCGRARRLGRSISTHVARACVLGCLLPASPFPSRPAACFLTFANSAANSAALFASVSRHAPPGARVAVGDLPPRGTSTRRVGRASRVTPAFFASVEHTTLKMPVKPLSRPHRACTANMNPIS